MISRCQHLESNVAANIRAQLSALDTAYWRDRRSHKPNVGLSGEVGHYFSCGRESVPQEIRQLIDDTAPNFFGYELEDWVVNKTPTQGGMPPHIDNEGYLAVALLCLQSGSGCFEWYHGNDLSKPEQIPDEAGQVIRFDQVDLIHAVPPAHSERYVIVFLYR